MATVFSYTARSTQGKFVAGSLRADNREQALAHLRTRALFVTSLGEPDTISGAFWGLFTLLPVSTSARNTFVRSLATLVKAGVPLRRALEIVTKNCHDARLRESLSSVASDIDSGLALSAGLEKRPLEFSRLFVAMIRAGELSGSLDAVLERIATFLERDNAARKRLRSALAYPLFVTVAAIALVLFLVSNTIPAFSVLFEQMHVPLPLTTRLLMALGNQLASPWIDLALACGMLGVFVTLAATKKTPVGAAAFDRASLWVPVVGAIVRMSLMARFSRILGTLLRSGVPLLSALDAARDVIGNVAYARSSERISDDLRQGQSVTQALERTSMFDDLMLALVRVGEETGSLDEMFLRIAEQCELDVETMIGALAGLLEPAIIVVLGAVVGTIVGSILIPLYSMIGSIK